MKISVGNWCWEDLTKKKWKKNKQFGVNEEEKECFDGGVDVRYLTNIVPEVPALLLSSLHR